MNIVSLMEMEDRRRIGIKNGFLKLIAQLRAPKARAGSPIDKRLC